jgi:hypothetical protein
MKSPSMTGRYLHVDGLLLMAVTIVESGAVRRQGIGLELVQPTVAEKLAKQN